MCGVVLSAVLHGGGRAETKQRRFLFLWNLCSGGNKKPCKSYREERGTGYSEAVLHGGLHVLHFLCAEVYLPSCSEPSFQVCTANHLRGQSALLWGRGDLFTVQDKSSGFLGSDSTQCVHTAFTRPLPMPPLGGRGSWSDRIMKLMPSAVLRVQYAPAIQGFTFHDFSCVHE